MEIEEKDHKSLVANCWYNDALTWEFFKPWSRLTDKNDLKCFNFIEGDLALRTFPQNLESQIYQYLKSPADRASGPVVIRGSIDEGSETNLPSVRTHLAFAARFPGGEVPLSSARYHVEFNSEIMVVQQRSRKLHWQVDRFNGGKPAMVVPVADLTTKSPVLHTAVTRKSKWRVWRSTALDDTRCDVIGYHLMIDMGDICHCDWCHGKVGLLLVQPPASDIFEISQDNAATIDEEAACRKVTFEFKHLSEGIRPRVRELGIIKDSRHLFNHARCSMIIAQEAVLLDIRFTGTGEVFRILEGDAQDWDEMIAKIDQLSANTSTDVKIEVTNAK